MKTITKYVRCVIFLNCISVVSLSAQTHMLKFEILEPEQKNIHAFLCKQAVFKDHKDTKNRFSVAISFVFENGARKTFLIKAPGGKSYFESGSLGIAKKHRYKAQLGDIIRDEKIGNYIDRKLRNNEYPEQEKYRLGDSEVSFLYAINNPNSLEKFQQTCVQSLAEKITHELARIELHGFTMRDMCPCCLSYMECFLKQSNEINKGGKKNDANNKDFKNFFECLCKGKNVKKHLPKGKKIPINFFISSLVELSSTEHKFSKYQDYHHKKEEEEEKKKEEEEEEEEEEEKKDDKKIEYSETIDGNGGNLYCIFLRDTGSHHVRLGSKMTSFSPRDIKLEENDYFALNMESNKPRYLGNWKDIKKYEEELKECTEFGEWLCGSYDNHLKEGIRWSRISPDGKSVKPLGSPSTEKLKKLKGSDLVSGDGFLFDPTTEEFSFDKARDKKGGSNDWYYYRYNSTKDSKDKKCEWQHITEDYRLEPISNMSDGKKWEFKQAKAMYNANYIFESVKEKRHGLNKEFSEHLKNFPESISDKNKEKQIYKIESGCAKVKWYEELKRFLKSRDNKQPISAEFSLPENQSKKFCMEQLNSKELKAFLRGFKPSEAILKRMQKYCEDGNESITKLSSLLEKPTKDFLVVFDKYDFGENASPAIFEGKGDVDLEDSDEYNSLFLYCGGEKYYKITPKTESQDAKKDVKKGNSKENSKDPFKISSSRNNSLKEKTEK